MHPRAIKLNELFSVNDFMATYDRSEGLGLPRPREINLSTNSYTNYFAYEPSMDRPNVCKASDFANSWCPLLNHLISLLRQIANSDDSLDSRNAYIVIYRC